MAIGNGVGEFTGSLTGLSLNSTYYIRAYAINSLGIGYSEQRSFTTKNGLATVTTGTATTTATSIAVGGIVTDNGGYAVTERGVCYSSTNSEPMITDAFVAGGKGNGEFSVSITGLSASTTYYIRAYATNENGISYGETITVVTQSGIPIVSTTQTTATSTNITSGGEITDDGGYNIIARGVCYSTSNSTPTIEDSYTTAGMGTGTFSTIITNVTVSTTFYVRAYATNSITTGYGEVITITTGDGLPTVITTPIGENVTETAAVSGGQVTDDGGSPIIERGICWGTVPYPTIENNFKITNGLGLGYFTCNITGIDLNTLSIYYLRAYAINANGIAYGNQIMINNENLGYKNMPSLTYGAYIYHLYPVQGNLTWDDANNFCNSITYCEFNDWYMPSLSEMQVLLSLCKEGWTHDGGFVLSVDDHHVTDYYWTTTNSNTGAHYAIIKYATGEIESKSFLDNQTTKPILVRPIRKSPINQ